MKLPKSLEKIVVGASLIGCLSGCGGKDSNPVIPDDNNPPQEDILEGYTNAGGEVSFIESNGNEVTLKVRDTGNYNLSNINVAYHDGSNFEAFFLHDPSNDHFPVLQIYDNNNSDHDIFMEGKYSKNKDLVDFVVGQIEGRLSSVNNFLNYKQMSGGICEGEDFFYAGTMSGEQMQDVYEVSAGIALFVGSAGGSEVVNYISALNDIGNISGLNDLLLMPISSNNWDVFDIGGHDYLTLGLDVKANMISNQPMINVYEPNVYGDNSVSIGYEGLDADSYAGLIHDPTVTCLGTENHDLKYWYSLDGGYWDYLGEDHGSETQFLHLDDLVEGNHTIRFKIEDETEINEDFSTLRSFNVSNSGYSNLEILSSFENPLGNGRLFNHNGQLWIHDSSNAYRVTHNYGIDSSSKKYIPQGTYDIVDIGNKCYGTLENSSVILELDDYSLHQTGVVGDLDDMINIDFCWNGTSLVGSSKVYSETYGEWYYFTNKYDVNNFTNLGGLSPIIYNSGQLSDFHNTSIDNLLLKTEWNNNFNYPYISGKNYTSSNFENVINEFGANPFESISQDVTSLVHQGNYVYSTTNKNGVNKINIHYLE